MLSKLGTYDNFTVKENKFSQEKISLYIFSKFLIQQFNFIRNIINLFVSLAIIKIIQQNRNNINEVLFSQEDTSN